MLKKLLSALLLICVYFSLHGQSISDLQSPKVLPPSPEAAALGRYGQIPVDKSTGVPSINIPLFEIKRPRLALPISISYHAGGIKVDDNASCVGLGWSLNAGGGSYPKYGWCT